MSLELELKVEIKRQMQEAIRLARAGDKSGSEVIFRRVLEVQPENEDALVWLAAVTEDRAEALRVLEKATQINPENRRAQAGVEWARKRVAEVPVPAAPPKANLPLPPPKILPSLIPELPSKSKSETKAPAAPYKKSRFTNQTPALVLPPEALPQETRSGKKRSGFKARRFAASTFKSGLVDAATPKIGLTVAENVTIGEQTGLRRANRVKVIWPLLLFGLAVTVALLSFGFAAFGPLLGVIALLATIVGVLLFNRAEF